MLRKIRTVLAVAVILLFTLSFMEIAELFPNFHIQNFQFLPALLSLNILALVVIIGATLLFGRIYCSVLCPLGIFQDFFDWLANRKCFTRKNKKKYGFKEKDYRYGRWIWLGILLVAWLCGVTVLVGLFDPYSAFGRMVSQLLRPLFGICNNIVATIAQNRGNFDVFLVDVSLRSVFALVVAVLTLLIIAHFSFHYGRTWCNTFCPVGTVLGFLSKYSLFKMRIDTSKCNHCGACAKKCKAYCIDSKNQNIDYNRCVDCFNCISNCKQGAIYYGLPKKGSAPVTERADAGCETVNAGRRDFIRSGMIVGAAVASQQIHARRPDKSGTVISEFDKQTPLSPAGSVSHDNLNSLCTACHMCIVNCPQHVLKPAGLEYGLGGVLQPVMSFDKGYCNFDCTICSDTCPAGAIKPISVEKKHVTQVGHVVFNRDKCVVVKKDKSCGACAEHCPVGGIVMVKYQGYLTIPETHTEYCIGCGGCEYICPEHAVHIVGNTVHTEATPPQESKVEISDDFDFGF